MSEQNNNKWLDGMIFKAVNNGKPQFNPEEFKQKFPDELEILRSRTSRQPQKQFCLKSIFNDPLSSLATSAVIVLMIGMFVFFSDLNNNTTPRKVHNVPKSHSELLTSRAMMSAYLRGGMEAVDEQNRKAVKISNQKPEEITIHELFSENNNI